MKFTDALDRSLENIKRPPNPPVGHYVMQVKKHPENSSFEARNSGKTFDRLEFTLVIVEAKDDVDPEELEEYGDPAGFALRKSFLFDNDDDNAYEKSLYNLRRFLEQLGVQASGESLSEALAQSVGAQCIGELKHRADNEDAEVIYAELGRTSAL